MSECQEICCETLSPRNRCLAGLKNCNFCQYANECRRGKCISSTSGQERIAPFVIFLPLILFLILTTFKYKLQVGFFDRQFSVFHDGYESRWELYINVTYCVKEFLLFLLCWLFHPKEQYPQLNLSSLIILYFFLIGITLLHYLTSIEHM